MKIPSTFSLEKNVIEYYKSLCDKFKIKTSTRVELFIRSDIEKLKEGKLTPIQTFFAEKIIVPLLRTELELICPKCGNRIDLLSKTCFKCRTHFQLYMKEIK